MVLSWRSIRTAWEAAPDVLAFGVVLYVERAGPWLLLLFFLYPHCVVLF